MLPARDDDDDDDDASVCDPVWFGFFVSIAYQTLLVI